MAQALNTIGADDPVWRFTAAAARHPERAALITPGQAWTFGELAEQVDLLAATLRTRGVTTGSTVGVCLPRDTDLVAALLAIWHTGAAFVALDPAQPRARHHRLLTLASADHVVTDTSRHWPTGVEVLKPASAPPAPRPRATPTRPVDAAPAYVIHTSGSTGLPKGVHVSRRNVAHLLRALERSRVYSPSEEPGRVAWLAGLSFDASVQQWLRVCRGDTLVLPSDDLREDPERLSAFLHEHRVTDLDATPSFWALLRPFLIRATSTPHSLRLLLGGEPVPPAMWRDLASLADRGHLRAVNLYGPAECTVDSTVGWITGPEPHIGRALPGVRAMVLDEALRPVEPGGIGEIYLAGDGVSNGYTGRPDLTAERYVADLLGHGTRMYRTGDRARLLPTGDLEYLGRADEQIKIRGHRVEPGEVEAVLVRHPSVTQAVVTAVDREPDDRRLVAHVVAAAGIPVPDQRELRTHCAASLPEAMVPSAVVITDAFPLTPNGKVDRAALPVPVFGGRATAAEPTTAQEDALCRAFTHILGVERVAPTDSFFDLGGHSLLAMRLIARLRSRLGVTVRMRDLFESPTPAELVKRLGAPDKRPPLRPRQRPTRPPLSSAQRRLWFLDRLHGPGPAYNEHVAFRFTGTLDPQALRAALAAVVARHEPLRTVFPEYDGEPYQHVLPAAAAAPGLSVRPTNEEGLQDVLSQDVRTPFDLASQPPLRATLFALAPDTHVLLLVMHHIASDGWSLGPLARDLANAYQTARRGSVPRWSDLPVQYVDYALWQEALFAGAAGTHRAAAKLEYWRSALDGMPQRIALPADRARSGPPAQQGGAVPFTCTAELHRELLRLARAHGCTLFMVLRAALAALLTRLGAGEDIPLGTVTAGRDEPELDDLVGFFVNTLVLRTDTSGDPAFTTLLDRVRDADLAAAEHQDLPFDRVVEALNPERAADRQPLFQVLLALQNNAEAVWDFGDVAMTTEPVQHSTAKFDLALSVVERYEPQADGPVPTGLGGTLEYATDLFESRTAELLVAGLVQVLETAAAHPRRPLSGYVLGSLTDKPSLLAGPEHDDTEPPTLLALFAEHVRHTPDAIAVEFEGEHITYAELDARVARLAALLTRHGVGRDHIVASVLPRSVDLVAAVLAIARTGAAYLPVDPGYPAERIAFLLRDAAPDLLLTAGERAPDAVPGGIAKLALPSADSTDNDRHGDDTGAAATAAYVIYTSGSTGQPKGVVVGHRALANLAAHQRLSLHLQPSSRVLQFASPGFDASIWEITMALAVGCTLVMAPAARLRPGPELCRLVDEYRITHLTLPPAVLTVLPDGALSTVTHLIVAGEAPAPEQIARWAPGRVLINAYGPTESTVCASMSRPLAPLPDGTAPPMGTPVARTRLYVLDAHLRPVLPGAAGELYVAGASLAQGYLSQPGITAERFVADPFGQHGARMYRTGDIVRINAEEELEFIGRADRQVKVRGHRIELGEVEAVIARHPEVARVAVAVQGERADERKLVAYVIPATEVTGPVGDGERVDGWRAVHDSVYEKETVAPFGEDFGGWYSSYNGRPLPERHMREWRDATVRRIRELRPRRILELGVGRGLLLARLVADVDEYWGLDLSAPAIDRLRAQVTERPEMARKVVLRRQQADDATGIPRGRFDVVVLNSVAQYFPSGSYLEEVLDNAAAALAPGGNLFVGDLRNLRLHTQFHWAVAQRKTGEAPGSTALAQAVRRSLRLEKELLVDPAYFTSLAAASEHFTGADIRLRRGTSPNELTRYRYDVVLRTDATAGPAGEPEPRLQWGADLHGLDEIRSFAERRTAECFRITGIPNMRLTADLRAQGISPTGALDPEEVALLAEELGFTAALRWSDEHGHEAFDAVFVGAGVRIPEENPAPDPAGHDPKHYVNDPLPPSSQLSLDASVLARAAASLPSFMVPAAVVVMEDFPLTPHGKLDRSALPDRVPTPTTGSRAPRNPREEQLCALYAEVLSLDQIGVDDSFFDLGGHSLLATRLVSRIRAALGVEVPVSTVFAAPRVRDLADQLGEPRKKYPALRRMNRPS
ncbi:amino acid adenylation domain-containing protein [Streptomyces hygroscopicus]|uniref:amino acid adenylation domain-containing protein n=1 Tax=Streptomyces hygroscopicus TaxID=1912 RepID=UPI0036C6BC89